MGAQADQRRTGGLGRMNKIIQKLKRFFHDYLGWHEPIDEVGFDGCRAESEEE